MRLVITCHSPVAFWGSLPEMASSCCSQVATAPVSPAAIQGQNATPSPAASSFVAGAKVCPSSVE